VANWRREKSALSVHVLIDGAATALCELDRSELGATLWDTGDAARDLCRGCSRTILAAATLAIATTERISSTAELETAKQTLRALTRTVPESVTRDLVLYARACLVRGDPKGAHDALRRWRANMRAIGVFGEDD
jgi:hypothetical protein